MSRSTAAAAGEAVEVLLAGFIVYLREQRGVSGLTIDAYVGDVRRFLTARDDVSLRDLTAAEVSQVVLGGPVEGRAPATVTCCSCIACSSADWVRGLARLISSANRSWPKIGPGMKRKLRLPPLPSSRPPAPAEPEGTPAGGKRVRGGAPQAWCAGLARVLDGRAS